MPVVVLSPTKGVLNLTNFVNPPLMSSAFKGSFEPDVYDLQNEFFVQYFMGEAQNIEVVVSAAKFCGDFVNNVCRPDCPSGFRREVHKADEHNNRQIAADCFAERVRVQ